MRFFRLFFVMTIGFIFLFNLISCSEKSSSKSKVNPAFPNISLKDLAKEGCLNVEALQELIQADVGNSPGYQVTTDFKVDGDFGATKQAYHTHAAFDLKEIGTQDIVLLNQPVQSGCSSVAARTASGEELVYKISSSSENSLKLVLSTPDQSHLSNYRLTGLKNKLHPLEYEISVLGTTHIRVKTKYKGFDAHCRGKSHPISTLQTDYMWARAQEFLPKQLEISSQFLQNYINTTRGSSGSPVEPPVVVPPVAEEQPETDPNGQPPEGTRPPVVENPAPSPEDGPSTGENEIGSSAEGSSPEPEAPILPHPRLVLETIGRTQDGYTSLSVFEVRELLSRSSRDELVRCKN